MLQSKLAYESTGVIRLPKKKNNSGFTSTQILLVIIVIAGIVGVVFSSRLLSQSGKAANAEAAEEIDKIGIALDTYAKDNGDYPSTDQGIIALWEKPEIAPMPVNWNGPYLEIPIIKDPWGRDYIYIRPGVHNRFGYDLISFGADGMEGGTGEKEDVVSWIRPDE